MRSVTAIALLSLTTALPAAGPAGWETRDGMLLAPAGRSPMPTPSENRTEPIPAPRLQAPQGPELAEPPAAGEVVPWNQARRHLGRTITVEGEIVVTNNIGSLTFLNFDEDWRGRFYLVVFDEVYSDLPAPPEEYFLNRTVRATGEVEYHNGDENKPQIQIHDARRIEVVDSE